MPLGGLLPYVGQALDPRMMQRALQTGGAAGPSALFSPSQHAAVNPPPADFSLGVDPRSAFEGKLNDPLFRAMFGQQGTLAAAATAGGLAADSQRNMLAPTQDNQALQAEAMRQQGWMQQRQQEAAQFGQQRTDAQQFMRTNLLQDDVTQAANFLTAAMESPLATPETVQAAREQYEQARQRLLRAAGVREQDKEAGGERGTVEDPIAAMLRFREGERPAAPPPVDSPDERRRKNLEARIRSDPAALNLLLQSINTRR